MGIAEELKHVEKIRSLEATTLMKDWFSEWRRDLTVRHPLEGRSNHLLPLRETVLEALSDSAPEQFLNPLAAAHLRRFGRLRFKDDWFWVRTEWDDVDICYGLAPNAGLETDWDPAWETGDTGDLGQLEVKVCYEHVRKNIKDQLRVLGTQLEARRERDKPSKLLATRRPQRYHGLVWLFQHSGYDQLKSLGAEIVEMAMSNGLSLVEDFHSVDQHDEFERLWPTFKAKNYTCGMTNALFELQGS
jgi:hypothetical protein